MAKKNKKIKVKAQPVLTSSLSNSNPASKNLPLERTNTVVKPQEDLPIISESLKKEVWHKRFVFKLKDNWENIIIWWSALDLKQRIVRIVIFVAIIVTIAVALGLALTSF